MTQTSEKLQPQSLAGQTAIIRTKRVTSHEVIFGSDVTLKWCGEGIIGPGSNLALAIQGHLKPLWKSEQLPPIYDAELILRDQRIFTVTVFQGGYFSAFEPVSSRTRPGE